MRRDRLLALTTLASPPLCFALASAVLRWERELPPPPEDALITLLAPNNEVYNSTDKLLGAVDALAASCASLTPIQTSATARATRAVRLTSSASRPKASVLVSFGVHGREYITSEVGLAFLHALCDGSARSQRLLDAVDLVVVPVTNVAGRKKMEGGPAGDTSGDACASRRKNENGVDINRNFGVSWQQGDTDPTSEAYRGPHPNSEPQAVLLDSLATQHRPSLYVDVHSGAETMMFPYAADVKEAANADEQRGPLDAATKVWPSAAARPSVGASSSLIGYLASGTTIDYMYVHKKVPLAYTWEIFQTSSGNVPGQSARRQQQQTRQQQQMRQQQLLQLDRNRRAPSALQPDHAATPPDHAAFDAVSPLPGAHAARLGHGLASAVSLDHGLASSAVALTAAASSAASLAMDDCFAYFNPTSAAGVAEVRSLWTEALLRALEHHAEHHTNLHAETADAATDTAR